MKKVFLLVFFLTGMLSCLYSQTKENIRIPLIGEYAPSFKAQSTMGEIDFPRDFFGKWTILFSHPADFTPVCSTEILELATMEEEFNALNTRLVVISTDGLNSHIEWVRSLEDIDYKGNKDIQINFPIVSDVSLEISRKYGMIHPSANSTKDIRGVFIIDPDNQVRAIFFYPLTTGRNLEEIKRTLVALQTTSKENYYTPANWEPGDDVLLPSPASKEEAEKFQKKGDPSIYSLDWYIWYKRVE